MSDSPASRAEPRNQHLAAIAVVAVLFAVAITAVWRTAPPLPPAPDHRSAEPWMTDALPGIGTVRRDSAAAAIRRGDLEALPRSARGPARALFAW